MQRAEFEKVYKTYYSYLVNKLYHKLEYNMQAAEDAAQDIFFTILKNDTDLSFENAKKYLTGAANKKYFDITKRWIVRQKYISFYASASGTDFFDREELIKEVRLSTDSITAPACRSIVKMILIDELPQQLVGKILNIELQVVRNQLSRGLKIMKEDLKKRLRA